VSSEHCIVASWSPGQPSRSFLTQINCSPMWLCGVVGDALASSKRSGKSTGCWPRTPSVARERVFRSRLRHYGDGTCRCCDPWLEPILSTAAAGGEWIRTFSSATKNGRLGYHRSGADGAQRQETDTSIVIGNAARYAAPLARCGPSALQVPSARHGFDALRLPARLAGRYVGQDPVALTTRMRPGFLRRAAHLET